LLAVAVSYELWLWVDGCGLLAVGYELWVVGVSCEL